MSLDIYLRDPTATYDNSELHWQNITHNLAQMADEAGIYICLWRPLQNGFKTAEQLIEPLKLAIERMKARPEHYRQWDAKNGWGTREQFVPWLQKLLSACEEYPLAEIEVSV